MQKYSFHTKKPNSQSEKSKQKVNKNENIEKNNIIRNEFMWK